MKLPHDFMPGMTVAKCDKLFDVIKPQIMELIKKIKESNETASKNIYDGTIYPENKQEVFTKNIASAIGYDYGSGIMIKTKRHQRTYGIGSHDVRTSLRCDEYNPEDAILTAIHEGGHGIAAQKLPYEYYGMPIGTEPGMDTAEAAEVRRFENNLGRRRAFWQYWLPPLTKEFGPKMDNILLDDMYSHVNRLNIGPHSYGCGRDILHHPCHHPL
jgi:carboxypeptidase Taq